MTDRIECDTDWREICDQHWHEYPHRDALGPAENVSVRPIDWTGWEFRAAWVVIALALAAIVLMLAVWQ